jgi:hypothetical protein
MSEQASGATSVGLLEREAAAQEGAAAQQEQLNPAEFYDQLLWEGRRLEAEEEERRGGVVPFANHEKGVFLIVESSRPGDGVVAGEIAKQVGGLLSKSQEIDPTSKSRHAMWYANQILARQPEPQSGRSGDRHQVAITLMHFSPGEDGEMQLHTASIGGGKAIKYPNSDESRRNPVELNENSQPSVYMDGSEDILAEVEYTFTDAEDFDRFAIVSSAVVQNYNYTDSGISKRRHHKAAQERTPKEAAITLLGRKRAHRDKDVIVVDAGTPGDEPEVVESILPGAETTENDSKQERQRGKISAWFGRTKGKIAERWAKLRGSEKKVGRHALKGAGVEELTVTKLIQRLNEEDGYVPNLVPTSHRGGGRSLWRRANDRAIDGMGARSLRREERRQRRETDFYQANWNRKKYSDLDGPDRAIEIEKNRRNRKIAKRVLLLAGAVGIGVALKKAGMDIVGTHWPFGGDGDGVDIGPWHGSSSYQSTPGNPVHEQWYGSFLDDDPARPLRGTTHAMPGSVDDFPDRSQYNHSTDASVWHPETRTVSGDSIYTNSLQGQWHAVGHERFGDAHFTGDGARNVDMGMRHEFGDNYVLIDGQDGTIEHEGDQWLRGNGTMRFRTEEMENRFDELMEANRV